MWTERRRGELAHFVAVWQGRVGRGELAHLVAQNVKVGGTRKEIFGEGAEARFYKVYGSRTEADKDGREKE